MVTGMRALLCLAVVLLVAGHCLAWSARVDLSSRLPKNYGLANLTKDAVEKIAKNRSMGSGFNTFVIVTTTNLARVDFAINWVRMHERLGLDNYIIVAEDEASYEHLYMLFPGRIFYNDDTSARLSVMAEEDLYFGSKGFGIVASRRPRIIEKFLKMDIDVFYSDIDTILMRDPFAHMVEAINRESPPLDIVGQNDVLRQHDDYVCTGFMYLRSNLRTIRVVDKWRRTLEDHPGSNQRIFFGILLNDRNKGDSGIQFDTLPAGRFSSGNVAFRPYRGYLDKQIRKRNYPDSLPIMIHLNFANTHQMKFGWVEQYNLLYTFPKNVVYRYNTPGWHCGRFEFDALSSRMLQNATVDNLSSSFSLDDIPATEFVVRNDGGDRVLVTASEDGAPPHMHSITTTGLHIFELHHVFVSSSGHIADPCHGCFSSTASIRSACIDDEFSKEVLPIDSAILIYSKPFTVNRLHDAIPFYAPMAGQACRLIHAFPWITVVVETAIIRDVIRAVCKTNFGVHVLQDLPDKVLYAPHLQVVVYDNITNGKIPVMPGSLRSPVWDGDAPHFADSLGRVAVVGEDSMWTQLQNLSGNFELVRVSIENYHEIGTASSVLCSSRDDIGWVSALISPQAKLILLDLAVDELEDYGEIFNKIEVVRTFMIDVQTSATRDGWVEDLKSLIVSNF